MKDFIMCKIIAVLNVKKITVNPSFSWTMKKQVKMLIFKKFIPVFKKTKLEWKLNVTKDTINHK